MSKEMVKLTGQTTETNAKMVTLTQQTVKLTRQTAETNAKMVTLTEETVKMNEENEKQGKTLMVFTIVTIIFLPLSFMAAFFAINIGAFHRNDKGFLDLGYVSEIMFPISAVITAVFIYLAFKADRLEQAWKNMTTPRQSVKLVVMGGVVRSATEGRSVLRRVAGDSPV